jgi:small subunit ribosomal protein S8
VPVTDPIADMLTRIRNGLMARHETVFVPSSKTKLAVAQILKTERFIQDFDTVRTSTPQRAVRIRLAYSEKGEPVITGLRRVSRPGLRLYVQKGEIPRVFGGLGIAIISTSQGLLTGREAWKRRIGGELLCYIW